MYHQSSAAEVAQSLSKGLGAGEVVELVDAVGVEAFGEFGVGLGSGGHDEVVVCEFLFALRRVPVAADVGQVGLGVYAFDFCFDEANVVAKLFVAGFADVFAAGFPEG